MRAGELRGLVTVQEQTVTRDDFGGEQIAWTTFLESYAAVEPITGREYIALRTAQSDITIRFRLRWRAGVDTTMRVLWKSVAYPIVEAIDKGARNVELILMCRGPADG